MRISVHHLPLACCAIEVSAAVALDLPAQVGDLEIAAGGEGDLAVLVIAGTVSARSVDAVREAWEELPEPKAAIAFGVCASSGGPYWDSYSVTSGAADVVPISRFVPGCPPPRSAVLDAIVATTLSVVSA